MRKHLLLAAALSALSTGIHATPLQQSKKTLTLLRENLDQMPLFAQATPARTRAQLAALEENMQRIIKHHTQLPDQATQSFLDFYAHFPAQRLALLKKCDVARLRDDIDCLNHDIAQATATGLPIAIARDMIEINQAIHPLLLCTWYLPDAWYKELEYHVASSVKKHPGITALTVGLTAALIITAASR